MHPNDIKIKLLAVADGIGGKQGGEIASNYVTRRLYDFFVTTDKEKLNDTLTIANLLKDEIIGINNSLISKYGENTLGTTLTLSLVNHNQTIILNIGDSRAYTYKDNNLSQITDDDSIVWSYYKYGEVDKEELRFLANANIINGCIGLNNDLCKPKITFKDNDSYDMLLLLTDGVTDLLTDEKIKFLINNTKKDEIIDNLIKEAVHIDQELYIPTKLRFKYLNNVYLPKKGEDNATVALLIKKKNV